MLQTEKICTHEPTEIFMDWLYDLPPKRKSKDFQAP